ncbi:MAG: hypothetical protein IPL11_19640 [Candidatus Accumulibacter sp.]|nr:hypothetical protein [Accumulibacter sp.]
MLAAQMHSAQARLKIPNRLEGLSVDAEVRALDNVREQVRSTVAEARMGSGLVRDSDLDVKLAKLRQSSGAIPARQQLRGNETRAQYRPIPPARRCPCATCHAASGWRKEKSVNSRQLTGQPSGFWAGNLRPKYLAGEASVFVLYRNVFDRYQVGERYYTLLPFLSEVLLPEPSKAALSLNSVS